MIEIVHGQIATAIISVIVLIGIFAALLYIMYIALMAEIRKKTVDNSLHDECKKAEEKKNKVIETLNREKQILMNENTRIMGMNEELAILLSQEKQ